MYRIELDFSMTIQVLYLDFFDEHQNTLQIKCYKIQWVSSDVVWDDCVGSLMYWHYTSLGYPTSHLTLVPLYVWDQQVTKLTGRGGWQWKALLRLLLIQSLQPWDISVVVQVVRVVLKVQAALLVSVVPEVPVIPVALVVRVVLVVSVDAVVAVVPVVPVFGLMWRCWQDRKVTSHISISR